MNPANGSAHELGVVIITRNEAARVAACIESVLRAIKPSFANADVVVIDSDSSDDTTAIAARYPVRVFRYRALRMSAAAGRWIGAQRIGAPYVLFLDGDCELVPGWLELAIVRMRLDPTLGVIHGARRNVENGVVDTTSMTNALGGTALYRREALIRCKGFNPFIIACEEQELRIRLEAAGYRAVHTIEPMLLHHTIKKETIAGMWRRYSAGMQGGPGQVLRIAWRDGLFLKHARRFNRYIATAVYLLAGALAALATPIASPVPLLAWAFLGALSVAGLAWRRRSVRDATFIVADWTSVAIGSLRSFVESPRPHEDFTYSLEELTRPMRAPIDRRAASGRHG
ncbi:MAG: glycosyltransferase family 2 protein [Deltaproteobacteria bacterium]|nr:glycosyltransferase family 2 protein [Deltaproteobacteria bacterium]